MIESTAQAPSPCKTVLHQADLCVVGGGLAGVCAAIAAARHGCKTVLMHERPVLGGNASSEIRMWVCGAHGSHNRATGIIEELELENYYRNPDKNYYLWDTVLLSAVQNEPNITLLLNCSCCEAEMAAHDRIQSVTGWQMTTQTWHKVKATFFADCSGDSILAPLTGADFRIGREATSEFDEHTSVASPDKKTMGMSCLLQIRRGYKPTVFTPPSWVTEVTEEMARDRFPDIYDPYENFWSLELGGEDDSIADTEVLRDRLLALALGVWNYIKNSGTVKDADMLELSFLGFLPGKRESRRMLGPCLMTKNDIMAGGLFEDTVAFGGWTIDDHDPRGFYKQGVMNTHDRTPAPYGIPLRTLYSRNIGNLFFAGRNISMTHAAMSSARVMATCALLGQAVGTAASVAVTRGLLPAAFAGADVEDIRQMLMQDGCFLPGARRRLAPAVTQAQLGCDMPVFGLDCLRNGADRDHPCYGTEEQGCMLPLRARISYTFGQPQYVSSVRLSFDSDLDRLTLPGDFCERSHSMRANEWPDSPTMCMPKTLVREFVLEGEDEEGNTVVLAHITDMRRATATYPVGAQLRALTLIPLATWDETATEAHIYSFDFAVSD